MMPQVLDLLQILGLPYREIKIAERTVRHYVLPSGQVLEVVF